MRYRPEGQGLRFEGYPSDVERFYRVLADHGCHPKATERILERLKENGHDLLTVQSDLNFTLIGSELQKIGISVTYIKPLENWYHRYVDGDWPEWALPDSLKNNKLLNK